MLSVLKRNKQSVMMLPFVLRKFFTMPSLAQAEQFVRHFKLLRGIFKHMMMLILLMKQKNLFYFALQMKKKMI